MAPQRIHELAGGGRVTVVDTGSAAEHLTTMLQRFRDGNQEPLIFSDSATGEPEGVVISFGQWLAFLQAEDEAASARIQEPPASASPTPRLRTTSPWTDLAER